MQEATAGLVVLPTTTNSVMIGSGFLQSLMSRDIQLLLLPSCLRAERRSGCLICAARSNQLEEQALEQVQVREVHRTTSAVQIVQRADREEVPLEQVEVREVHRSTGLVEVTVADVAVTVSIGIFLERRWQRALQLSQLSSRPSPSVSVPLPTQPTTAPEDRFRLS